MRTQGIISGFLLVTSVHAQAPLKTVEYWFDQSETIYAIPNPVNSALLDLADAVLNSDGLPVGPHMVHLRLKEDLPGANGARYSSVVSRPFQKYHSSPWQLVQLRYWVSQSEQPTDMRYKEIVPPQTEVNLMDYLEFCGFPQGPQTVKFQWKDNHGQWSVVETAQVTIEVNEPMAVSAINAAPPVLCPGTQVVLTAVPQSGSSYFTPTNFTWSVPAGWAIVSGQGSISVTVEVGTVGGIVSVVAGNACDTIAPFTIPVVITPPPVIAAGTAEPDPICPSTTGLAYSVTPGNAAWTYDWNGPAGWSFSGSTAAIVATTSSEPGSGNISITATDACGQGSNTVLIPVSIAPEASAAGTISGPLELCAGTSAEYEVAPIANALTYYWAVTSGTVNDSGPLADVTTGAADFSITVHGVNACGIAGPASPSFAVDVLADPGSPMVLGDEEACGNEQVSFTAEPFNAEATYAWEFPNGWDLVPSGNTLGGTVQVGAEDGLVTVTVTTACGTAGASMPVVALDIPATPGPISGDTVVCAGTEGNYSIASVTDADTYGWSGPWSLMEDDTNVIVTFSGGNGMLSVVAQNGCGNSATTTFDVQVDLPPQQPVIVGDTQLCHGEQNTLEVGAPIQGETYVWSGLIEDTAASVIVSSEGALTLTAFTTPACPSLQSSVQVYVDDLDVVSIDGPADIEEFGPQTYAAVPALNDATEYLWTWSGTDIAQFVGDVTGDTVTLDFFANGSGTLTVAAISDSCSGIPVPLQVGTSVGVQPLEAGISGWSVAPNPTAGLLVIRVVEPASASFVITNILGEVVYRGFALSTHVVVDLSGLANGPYTLRRTDDPGEVIKLVVQH